MGSRDEQHRARATVNDSWWVVTFADQSYQNVSRETFWYNRRTKETYARRRGGCQLGEIFCPVWDEAAWFARSAMVVIPLSAVATGGIFGEASMAAKPPERSFR